MFAAQILLAAECIAQITSPLDRIETLLWFGFPRAFNDIGEIGAP
jgi:hypothetical protein